MKKELQLEDFRLAVLAIWENKILLIALAVFGMFAGIFYTTLSADSNLYKGTSSVYCATYNIGNQTSSLTTDITAAVTNYTDVITSDKVAEYAASLVNDADLTAADVKDMISIQINSNSYVISIMAYSSDPNIAMEVANGVAQAFVAEMSSITDTDSVHMLDSASNAIQVGSDSTIKNILIIAVIPVFIMTCFIVLRSLLSDQVRSIVQCVENEDEIVGIVPEIK